jgi:hypothetical protein
MSKILKISQGDYIVQVPAGKRITLDTDALHVTGNIVVEGTTTEIQTTNTTIADNIIVLNKGEVGPGITSSDDQSGFEIDRGTANGLPGGIKLSASLIFDESLSAFVLKTTSNTTDTLTDLYATTANLDKISSNDVGITLSLTNDNTTVTIETPNSATDYHDRTLVSNSIVTKQYLENYVEADSGRAIVSQLLQTAGTVTNSQVLATEDAIEFYVGETLGVKNLIGKILIDGIYIDQIQCLTSDTVYFASNINSAYNLTLTGNVSITGEANRDITLTTDGAGFITIASGTTGIMDNIDIGMNFPRDGIFNNLQVNTSATLPSGPTTGTGGRPANAAAGNIRYNTTIKSFEGFNGTLWGTVGGGLQSSPGIETSNYTALSNNLVRANSTAGGFTITLPDAPNDGDVVGIIDVANTFGISGKAVTVVPGAVGTIEGTTDVVLDLEGTFVSFVFIADVNNWKLEQTPTGPSSGSAGLTISNSRVVSRVITANDTPTALTFDGEVPSATNQLILPNDSTYTFSILVTARRTDADNESAGYKFEGVIDRNTIAATTNFVGVPIKTVLAEDSALWDCVISEDTVNGGLRITVTGEANKIIKWVAVCNTAEVTG